MEIQESDSFCDRLGQTVSQGRTQWRQHRYRLLLILTIRRLAPAERPVDLSKVVMAAPQIRGVKAMKGIVYNCQCFKLRQVTDGQQNGSNMHVPSSSSYQASHDKKILRADQGTVH